MRKVLQKTILTGGWRTEPDLEKVRVFHRVHTMPTDMLAVEEVSNIHSLVLSLINNNVYFNHCTML